MLSDAVCGVRWDHTPRAVSLNCERMAKPSRKSEKNDSPRIENRRAYHDYFITEKLECGIVLRGTEVKAIRSGQCTLSDAYAMVDPRTMELWLHNMEVGHYSHAAADRQHEAKSQRKLLAKRKQIENLYTLSHAESTTLVPLALYFNSRGIAKVEIGVGTGKSQVDKRQSIKAKETRRDIQRAMTRKRI